MPATTTCDDDVAAFALEVLDEELDIGHLCAAAFGTDVASAWRSVVAVAEAHLEGTTPRSRTRNKERRSRGVRILRTVLINPHTPTGVALDAVELAADAGLERDHIFRLFENKALAPQVIERVYQRWGSVYGYELTHQNTPVHVMADSIRANRTSSTIKAVAELDRLDPEVVEALVDTNDAVRRILAGRDDLSPGVYDRLAGDYRNVRLALAANPAAPVAVLERLTGDDEPSVRCTAAENPSTPDRVLVALLDDSDPAVVGTAFRSLRARGVITVADV